MAYNLQELQSRTLARTLRGGDEGRPTLLPRAEGGQTVLLIALTIEKTGDVERIARHRIFILVIGGANL